MSCKAPERLSGTRYFSTRALIPSELSQPAISTPSLYHARMPHPPPGHTITAGGDALEVAPEARYSVRVGRLTLVSRVTLSPRSGSAVSEEEVNAPGIS